MMVPCPSCGAKKAVHNCKARRGVIERGQGTEGREVLNTTGGAAMAPPATKEP